MSNMKMLLNLSIVWMYLLAYPLYSQIINSNERLPASDSPTGNKIVWANHSNEVNRGLKEMMTQAKKSILIDEFSISGLQDDQSFFDFLESILEEKIKQYPNFKIYFFKDFSNLGENKQLTLNFFQTLIEKIKRKENLKNSFYIFQSNIQKFRTGSSFGRMVLLKKSPELFESIEKLPYFYEIKGDRSQIIIVDGVGGKEINPQMYLGSIHSTEGIFIKGPAAVLFQQSFMDDIDAALTNDKDEQAWFLHKRLNFANLNLIADKQSILKNFKPIKEKVKNWGEAGVVKLEARLKNNNLIKHISETLVSAEKNIFLQSGALLNPEILGILKEKKQKNSAVDLRILVNKSEAQMVTLRPLQELGVPVRYLEKESSGTQFSVDGNFLIFGSFNLTTVELFGSFRQTGVMISDVEQINAFVDSYQNKWNLSENGSKSQISTSNPSEGDGKDLENLLKGIYFHLLFNEKQLNLFNEKH